MTADLFGATPALGKTRQAPPGADRDRSWLPSVNRWVQTPGGPHFYQVDGRAYSVEEIYRLSQFRETARARPNDEIVVVLDASVTPARVFLIALPRNHPSRLDEKGKPDPAKQPFWRHGEIMHIRPEERAPP